MTPRYRHPRVVQYSMVHQPVNVSQDTFVNLKKERVKISGWEHWVGKHTLQLHSRWGLESNHDHLSQCLEEGPTPLCIRLLICESVVHDTAIGRKVMQPHEQEVEATDPMGQDERLHPEPCELGESIGNAELQPLFEQQYDSFCV